MTSVYDIPYEDIKQFLFANDKNSMNENEDYELAFNLFKNKKSVGHTINIIEWLIAYNLLINKIDISIYTIDEIDSMSQSEINKLAKLLTMKGNNKENIMNILRFLHKLDEKMMLLPEISDIISRNLIDLDINDININIMKSFDDIINLLKHHANKSLVRKMIYNNIEKIVFHLALHIDYEKLGDLEYIKRLGEISKPIKLKLLTDNKEKILKNYNIKELNNFINNLPNWGTDIYGGIKSLSIFIVKLIEINEIGLAKIVFDITNKYEIGGETKSVVCDYYYLNEYLCEYMILNDQSINVLKILIDWIGEQYFVDRFKNIVHMAGTNLLPITIKNFLNKLLILKKYDLLLINYRTLIYERYGNNQGVLLSTLPNFEKAIYSKNDDLIIKYINNIDILKNNT